MYSITFESFPHVFGDVITIPANTIIYRSYDINYSPISNYPSYFGSKETASGYLNKNRKLGEFTLTKSLRFYDLRYLKILLKRLINSRKDMNRDILNLMKTVTLAYGICSYDKQIELLQERYSNNQCDKQIENMKKYRVDMSEIVGFNHIEPEGVRIGETTNDSAALVFIKKMFGNHVDGIISPKMFSPFHIEKNNYLSAELVIFDPVDAKLNLLTQSPTISRNIEVKTLLPSKINIYEYMYQDTPLMKINISSLAGGNQKKYLNRNKFFDDVLANKKTATKIYNKYMKIIDQIDNTSVTKQNKDPDSLDFWNTKDIIYNKPIDLGIDS